MNTAPSGAVAEWLLRAQALQLRTSNFIGGRWQDGAPSHSLDKFGPRDGKLLYHVQQSTPEEIEEAVSSAKRAYEDGRWSDLPVRRRKEVLHKLAAMIENRRDEFALLETLDVGKPIQSALAFDAPHAAAILRFSAEAIDKFYGDVYASDLSGLAYQLIRPVGVVAGLVGWNFPLVLAATKVGPALAMGNSLVLKPSELTALTTSRLAELAVEAGVPEGVLNVVHGDGSVGAALARHRDVRLLSFTGSTRTGKQLLVASGESNMKRLLLECGGKAPNIVFDDCSHLETIADAVLGRAFYNQGEVCTASSRLLVQRSIKDDLLNRIVKRASLFVPGDPLNPTTGFGALVSSQHKQKVCSYAELGDAEGARRAFTGDATAPVPGGYYVPVVIFDDVSAHQRIAQDEIFGPILSVLTFEDEEEAARLANSTIYGLSAIVWTRDLGRAHRISRRLDCGLVVINAATRAVGAGPGDGVLSVGGHKESGLGTEGGMRGLEAYTTATAVQILV